MNKLDQLKQLEAEGFNVTEYVVVKGNELTDDFLSNTLADCKEKSDFALDGVVIDVNDSNICDAMQAKKKGSSLNPPSARKYKVGGDDNVATSTVVNVEWNVSKHGLLKPRVQIVPVDLVGVTITYATAHNAKNVMNMEIGIGATINITRAGDVIPYILEVTQTGPEIAKPDVNEVGAFSFDGTDYILDDVSSNDEVKYQRLESAWNKLGVENVSSSGLRKLFEAGYETIASVIVEDDDKIYEVVGSRNAYKAKEHVRKLLNPVKLETLGAISGAYGRGIGERRLKKIVEDLDTFVGLTAKQIESVEGFSDITAQLVLDGEQEFNDFVDEIAGWFTIDTAAPAAPVTGGTLSGMIIVCTGFRLKGDNLDKFIAAGGIVADRVNKETTHVVCKDPTKLTGKVKKAHDAGIALLSGEAFEAMI